MDTSYAPFALFFCLLREGRCAALPIVVLLNPYLAAIVRRHGPGLSVFAKSLDCVALQDNPQIPERPGGGNHSHVDKSPDSEVVFTECYFEEYAVHDRVG
ncbi:uncharacterized protein CCOS01_03857 [Colletotrichum costaricense]|uniref:Secreted protein n=2 Tax=Colletotrichum acutatum species complex TaxID=2707335 RepID=A0AAI9Z5U4_9PEZI|nr:uncharacterized protein CCOS01_03857 [Colletotrichum costaricense]XP_060380949.1 uncharacterized protein CTAM01_08416 [Colletotrichum tamarilloi]KAI3540244.1 hypothetical protein CSPX01_08433 [Colletotrichum filicis]KAK1496229.1 hypothetical protein CTAM01_08416 [Colletotrichum tamarilloi]KAK1535105.1 hypothetical protein CCOS01_03857 [Colletotrichum costaricense]